MPDYISPRGGTRSGTVDGVQYSTETLEDGVNVYHFHVDPSVRRTGVGSRVLDAIVHEASAAGFGYVVVNMGGGDAAESFLRSHGFRIIEREPGGHVTAEKDLGGGDLDFS